MCKTSSGKYSYTVCHLWEDDTFTTHCCNLAYSNFDLKQQHLHTLTPLCVHIRVHRYSFWQLLPGRSFPRWCIRELGLLQWDWSWCFKSILLLLPGPGLGKSMWIVPFYQLKWVIPSLLILCLGIHIFFMCQFNGKICDKVRALSWHTSWQPQWSAKVKKVNQFNFLKVLFSLTFQLAETDIHRYMYRNLNQFG